MYYSLLISVCYTCCIVKIFEFNDLDYSISRYNSTLCCFTMKYWKIHGDRRWSLDQMDGTFTDNFLKKLASSLFSCFACRRTTAVPTVFHATHLYQQLQARSLFVMVHCTLYLVCFLHSKAFIRKKSRIVCFKRVWMRKPPLFLNHLLHPVCGMLNFQY